MKRAGRFYPLVFFFCFVVMFSLSGNAGAAETDLFASLRGKWGGSGTMLLKGGEKERLNCTADYSGSASQLRLAINCKSNFNKITMKARLSSNAGHLLGVWEEETYRAIGSIAGIATPSKITFYITGNVFGTMTVRYTKSRQEVSIKTQKISLRDVSITLRRR